jgi:hypothetical protein
MASLPLVNFVSIVAFVKVGSILKKASMKAFFHTRMSHCSTLPNFIQNVFQIRETLV